MRSAATSLRNRAAVVLSLVAGFQIMRQMIGLSSLTKAKPKDLVKVLAPLFQQLVEDRAPGGSK